MKKIAKSFCALGITVLLSGIASFSHAQTAAEYTTNTDALLKYQNQITTDYLKSHLSILAADSMEGRETAMPGQKKAARYLAGQYHAMGLKPMGDDGYFQHFKLNATTSDSVVFQTYAWQDGRKTDFDRSISSDKSFGHFIRVFGGTDSLQGKIIFAGFGVDDSAHGISHLKGADLKDKWVMVFQEIPNVVNGDTLINPAINARSRFRTILSKGATGIIVIPAMKPEEFKKTAQEEQADFGRPTNMRLAYRDTANNASRGFSRGYDVVDPEFAARLLGLENIEALESYRREIISAITDFEPKELGYGLSQIPYSKEVKLSSENVLALFEGGDPELKDEVVVMSAHYDHVGIGQPDSTGDRIYNGADDDGSGTVGLLNVAQTFVDAAKKGIRPRRSILFLHVAGEEKGLLGSRYYSDHMVFSVEKTVADLNTDMIGRIDPEHEKEGVENYTYVIGADIISSQLDSLIQVANKESGDVILSKRYNDLNDPNQFYRRSDHWNFGRLGIPFVFFFTGVHEDYHRPSDEVEKIRFEKMARIVRTMYASAVLVANTDHAPQVDNQAFIEITKE